MTPDGLQAVDVVLVDDDGPVDVLVDDDGPVDGGAAGRRPPPPSPRRSRNRWIAVGAIAGLALAAGVTAGLLRAGQESFAPLAGAVPPLGTPLVERWRVAAPQGWSAAAGLLLVPRREEGLVQVSAHDLTSGAERWVLEQPPGAVGMSCEGEVDGPDGPLVLCQAFGPLTPSREPGNGVVQDPGWLLLVSAADGVVAREIRLPPTHVGYGVSGGDLVQAWLELGEDLPSSRVHVERRDETAGALVWESRVAVPIERTRGAATMTTYPDVVVLTAVDAVLLDAADGSVLALDSLLEEDNRRVARPVVTLRPHGTAVHDAVGRWGASGWYRADGQLVGTFEGPPAEPALSDGSRPEVVLTGRGTQLVAVDVAAGTDLWSTPMVGGAPVLRHEGTVVVDGGDGPRALDLRTGEPAWTTDAPGLDTLHPVSDGTFVLAVGSVPGRGKLITAVSLGDGSVLWRAALPPGTGAREQADGAVVATGGGRVVGLG